MIDKYTREYRVDVLRMTAPELAAALGVGRATVERWDRGVHQPSPMANFSSMTSI